MVEKMREFQTLRGGKAESYNPKLTAARAKLAKIKAELAADLTANSVSTSQLNSISGYLKSWDEVSFDGKRRAVDMLISKIEATRTDIIHWKI